jgi:hypothetical protein
MKFLNGCRAAIHERLILHQLPSMVSAPPELPLAWLQESPPSSVQTEPVLEYFGSEADGHNLRDALPPLVADHEFNLVKAGR